jgi:histidine phosphotransferase ChpT
MNHPHSPAISPVVLAQLLVTKLCHDVANPVGAINNGMELLGEDPSMRDAAMELIGSSAQQAGARIQFYRYIFGMLKGEGIVDMGEKKLLIDAFYHGSKVEVVWQHCPHSITQADCQLLCNLLCIAGVTLVRGGVVTIDAQADGDALKTLRLTSTGTHLKLDADLREALLHHTAHTASAKSVQAYYTGMLVAEQGGGVTLTESETAYVLEYRV